MTALPTPTRRHLGLDLLRTLAIVGMVAAHTSRMIAFDLRPDWCRWILLLEPIIPSLFLLMVGISLTLSFARASDPKRWYLRQARRALVLWVIATIFYVLELGARFPDFVTASGILATIAYSILGVGALLLLPKREWLIAAALAAGTVLFLRIDTAGMRVFPLNIGNAPFLPLCLFALAGALWGLLHRRVPRILFWGGLGALVLAAWLVHRFGLDPLFTKPFGRSDATRIVAAPLTGGTEKILRYYNLRPVLGLLCLCLHVGALSLAGLLDRARGRAAAFVSMLGMPGRHSLELYVLHLTLLAVLVVTLGMPPLQTAAQGNTVLIGLYAICAAWAFLRDKLRARRRPMTQGQ